MGPSRAVLLFAVFVLGVGSLLNCGSSARTLQSVTINPAVANAADYPNGIVPFTATGTYNQQPLAVTPLLVAWWPGDPFTMQPFPGITIDAKGNASCSSFSGTAQITAVAPKDPSLPLSAINYSPSARPNSVAGSAELICP